ncbi:Transcriptional regulatory protein GlrR [bacterium HR17]|jgi:DNA-binding response OmpR family regulator|uniref:Transcriptional regulatory protein GlrR n=1 Tax=Candidatus Fervidibacter japonicus TaxID=2035412 RepID=A0A2H5XCP2_9BACT|nr:Transcriptional regulatory protein GlrR [bacterium HR17]
MPKARILVVEDEAAQRQLYCEELTAAGYEAIGAQSAEEAEETLSRERVDLVVLDLNMPGVSGLELLPRIHELHPGLPIIIHTAYGSYRDDFLSWLADVFLVKSPDTGNLVEAVEELLSRQRGVASGA